MRLYALLNRFFARFDVPSTNTIRPVRAPMLEPMERRCLLSAAVVAAMPAAAETDTNVRPVATILAPQTGGRYQPGELISFSGRAVDTEDGTLDGDSVTWTALFTNRRGVQTRIYGPARGIDSGSFVAPNLTSTSLRQNIRIRLRVMDSDGGVSTDNVTLRPVAGRIRLQANFPGLDIRVGQTRVEAPYTARGALGGLFTVSAPRVQTVGNATYEFSGWSDNGRRTHQVRMPANGSLFAVYRRVSQQPVTPGATNNDLPLDQGTTFGPTMNNGFSSNDLVLGNPTNNVIGQPINTGGSIFG